MVTIRNTKAQILSAHDDATAALKDVQQKLNVALALLASLAAIELLF
jgi:hypothetical protein